MSLLLIGDVHGKIEQYLSIIKDEQESIQIGDIAIGFPGVSEFDIKHGWNKFFVGNHDNRSVARNHPNYLGNWGYLSDKDIFFVSGAYSIDRSIRTPGVDWWADEELSHDTFQEILETYAKIKPSIVLTHASPESVKMSSEMVKTFELGGKRIRNIKSQTEFYLDEMLKIHKPRQWIFGHLHVSFDFHVDKTRFVCLNELETMRLEV